MTSTRTISRRASALSSSPFLWRSLVACATAAVLAACGGGGSSEGTPTAGDAAATSARALDATTSAAADADWVRIADENQAFGVQGTQTVRYGSGSSWIEKTVDGGGECSNAWFGSDPLVGVVKQCQVVATWTAIADEHQAFSVQGTQTVRYGIGSNWVTRTVSGGAECSNEWFGSDPAVGIVKVCQGASAGAADTGWTRIAGEGDSFGVNGTQTVRYGSGSTWIAKAVSASGQCTNEWFGLDPLVGVVKQCEVSSAPRPRLRRHRRPRPHRWPACAARRSVRSTPHRRRRASATARPAAAPRPRCAPRSRAATSSRSTAGPSPVTIAVVVADRSADRSQHVDRRRPARSRSTAAASPAS